MLEKKRVGKGGVDLPGIFSHGRRRPRERRENWWNQGAISRGEGGSRSGGIGRAANYQKKERPSLIGRERGWSRGGRLLNLSGGRSVLQGKRKENVGKGKSDDATYANRGICSILKGGGERGKRRM